MSRSDLLGCAAIFLMGVVLALTSGCAAPVSCDDDADSATQIVCAQVRAEGR